MISSFSVAGYFICRAPHPRSCFFEQAVLEHQLGNHLFQRAGFPAQVLDFGRRRRPLRVAGQALLTALEELLRPAVIEVLNDPFTAAQFGDAVFATQTSQHDADLFLRRKLPAGRAPDLLHNLLCRFFHRPGFLSHLRSFNGYDGPEILPSSTHPFCLSGADAGQSTIWGGGGCPLLAGRSFGLVCLGAARCAPSTMPAFKTLAPVISFRCSAPPADMT